jgi:hypothetical protein
MVFLTDIYLFIYLFLTKDLGLFFSLNSTLSFLFLGEIRQILDITKLEFFQFLIWKWKPLLQTKSRFQKQFNPLFLLRVYIFHPRFLALIPTFDKTEVTTEPQFQAFY